MCLWLYGEREGLCLHMYPHSLIKIFAVNLQNQLGLALVAQLDARLTCDQDVAGSIPPPPPPPPQVQQHSSEQHLWSMVMKYFPVIISLLLIQEVKKGSCQFLATECAQGLVSRLKRLSQGFGGKGNMPIYFQGTREQWQIF